MSDFLRFLKYSVIFVVSYTILKWMDTVYSELDDDMFFLPHLKMKTIDAIPFLRHLNQDLKTPYLVPPDPIEPLPDSGSTLGIYEKAAVCSDSQLCSNIGSQILQLNGSAVDAAIATLLCNGLVSMQSMGLGGGVLMNVYSHSEQRTYSVIGREAAPLKASPDRFQAFENTDELLNSPLSIAVPGEVKGYEEAHRRFGRLPFDKLVQPTIDLCHKGFLLTKHQRDAVLTNKARSRSKIDTQDMWKYHRAFCRTIEPDEVKRVGTHIQPPKQLCDTYERLAKEGPGSFYTGSLAEDIAADLTELGSLIEAADLKNMKADIVSSGVFPLGDSLLHLVPPPSSGYIIGFIMRVLEKFEEEFKNTTQLSGLEIHRIVEALKIGFVQRWKLDTDTNEADMGRLNETLYAQKMAKVIDDLYTNASTQYYGAESELLPRLEHGTAHISILAPNGDAVSASSSIHYYFGSGLFGSRTGIFFNNAMADFSIKGLPNYFHLPTVENKNSIKPGHIPMSSMSPLIVTDRKGNVKLVAGAAGGTKIISVLTQVLVRMLWLDQNVKQAIDAARFHHQLLPDVLEYEYGILNATVEELKHKNHTMSRYRERGSAVCGIEVREGVVYANADYRKDGDIAGY